MHTIIPGMLMQKTPGGGQHAVMPFGVMGGHFQPMGQSLFLANHFEYGLDLQEAIDLPRVFPSGGTGAIEAERGVPLDVLDRLSRLGHEVRRVGPPHGGGQAVFIDRARGLLIGASDPRKDGLALGY
jgi:gamma-glutamyltranspeptidase/glutathione hydrolase